MSAESWKLSLPCTRAEAEAIDAAEDVAIDAVLMTSEEVEDDPLRWRLDAYFESKPNKAVIAAVQALVPSAERVTPKPERLPDEDWVTLSQAGLEAIEAGRFFVTTEPAEVPPGMTGFRIPASRAFGTGHHETTAGCLAALDLLKRQGVRADNLIDLGTGTGLLAFAAMTLWPRAYASATDIDPVSIEVTAENAAANGFAIGQRPGELALAVADGTDAELVQRRAPYDMIIANILAGPLIALAPQIAAIAMPGTHLILAGLLETQAEKVASAYRAQGFRVSGRETRGHWTILRLRLRQRYGAGRTTRLQRGTTEAPGFGTW